MEDHTGRPFQIRVSQMEKLNRRSQQLFWALRFLYASLGLFASAALIAVIGSVMSYYNFHAAFEAIAVLGMVTFVFAVLGLVSGCVLMVREVQLALASLSEEASLAREHYRP